MKRLEKGRKWVHRGTLIGVDSSGLREMFRNVHSSLLLRRGDVVKYVFAKARSWKNVSPKAGNLKESKFLQQIKGYLCIYSDNGQGLGGDCSLIKHLSKR